jgi:hypothetical protein
MLLLLVPKTSQARQATSGNKTAKAPMTSPGYRW